MDAVEMINNMLKPYIPNEAERMLMVCKILTVILRDVEEHKNENG